jgi:hypothetical protein
MRSKLGEAVFFRNGQKCFCTTLDDTLATVLVCTWKEDTMP